MFQKTEFSNPNFKNETLKNGCTNSKYSVIDKDPRYFEVSSKDNLEFIITLYDLQKENGIIDVKKEQMVKYPYDEET